MLEGKKDTDKWFPVILTDDGDFKTAKTGKFFGDVTCKYSYEAAVALSTHTVTTDEWKEVGEGKYWLRIGASEFTSEGKYEVSVAVAGCLTFNFPVEVRDKTVAENMNDLDIVDTVVDGIKDKTDNLPVNTSTELDNIDTALTAVQADLDNPDQYKADVMALATAAALATHDGKLDTVDGIVDDIKSYLVDGGRIDLLLDIINTIVDAIKLKTDTLGGVGAIEWNYTLTEVSTGNPIADADIWVTTDEEGNNVIASGKTDQDGEVTFYLDAGTISVWRQKSGWNFDNPDTEVVS